MYSVRNTHSSSCTEPMMKPVDPMPRHSSRPALTPCAPAPAGNRVSAAASARPMVDERILLPLRSMSDLSRKPSLRGARRATKQSRGRNTGPQALDRFASLAMTFLFQVSAEALDAVAGFFQVLGLGCVGNPER